MRPFFLSVPRRSKKVCVDNSKKHLTKRFMGQRKGHRALHGFRIREQYSADADGTADDVRQAETAKVRKE